jgi:hypothetical protein
LYLQWVHLWCKARRNGAALLLARILGDAIVKCLNFSVESFKRSLTRDTVLARRRIFASRHRLNEVFDVDAANLATCHMIEPILLRMMRTAIGRGISCRRIGASRLSDCNCRG